MKRTLRRHWLGLTGAALILAAAANVAAHEGPAILVAFGVVAVAYLAAIGVPALIAGWSVAAHAKETEEAIAKLEARRRREVTR